MFKNLFLTIILLAISTFSLASSDLIYAPVPPTPFIPSVYMSLQGGYGLLHWKHFENSKNYMGSVSGDHSVAARFGIGYSFMKHFSLEGGYTQFFNDTKIANFKSTTGYKLPYYSWAVDVVTKIDMNFTDDFGVYTKVGFDYMNTVFRETNKQKAQSTYNLAFGAGLTYNITTNLVFDLSWMRYNGVAEWNRDYMPFADFFAAGLTYHLPLA